MCYKDYCADAVACVAYVVCRQGDVNLYTNAALKARQQLRTDADVSFCIRRQWAQLSIVNPDDPGVCGVCLPARPMLASIVGDFPPQLYNSSVCVLCAVRRGAHLTERSLHSLLCSQRGGAGA